MLEVLPVLGIGEVVPGADLAILIGDAAPWLRDDDVLVVTSKIVSKAEGRLVELPPPGPARERRREEILVAESARTVAARGVTRIVATHHGFVMANAGIDSSNVDPDRVALLPKDPDASARTLRDGLAARLGVRVAVVVSDTMGRPWRNGLTDVALGAAGIEPLRDHRGETDPYGNQLHLTQLAVVDELAAAAELVKGKNDRIPVAVIRGLGSDPGSGSGSGSDPGSGSGPGSGLRDDAPGVVAALVRDPAQDMFPLGSAEAHAAGLRHAATLPDAVAPGPADQAAGDQAAADRAAGDQATAPRADLAAAAHRAVATVAGVVATDMEVLPTTTPVITCTAPGPGDPAALVRLGADVHRLRAALAAENLDSQLSITGDGKVRLFVTPTTG